MLLLQFQAYLPAAQGQSIPMPSLLSEDHAWQLLGAIVSSLLAVLAFFVVRALNNFTRGQAKLESTTSELSTAVQALTTEMRVLQSWQSRTVDPILSQVMHMIYNNYRDTKPPKAG